MDSDNAVSSCHLPEWVEMGLVCLGGGMRAGMGCRWEEKVEGVAGAESKAGSVGS
jgi:hypothetical protein